MFSAELLFCWGYCLLERGRGVKFRRASGSTPPQSAYGRQLPTSHFSLFAESFWAFSERGGASERVLALLKAETNERRKRRRGEFFISEAPVCGIP